jgi:L-ascorbate metabolism protein UlaG (beta-lactamase superfamily)
MFSVCFLGHQGWLFSTGGTNILLDALLCDSFGHDPSGHAFEVYPPRRIDLARCPAIDAAIFSHEHEDHFHVPSIEKLDRKIPVFLSARSSRAAYRLLEDLGFVVRPLQPGEPLRVGDLRILPLAQESLGGSHPGEWDALALYVCDGKGHGSFFSTVDHRPHVRTFEMLRQHRLLPTFVSYADNEMDYSALFPWATAAADGDGALAEELRQLVERAIRPEHRPAAVLLCANGFAVAGELAWMNRVFHRDAHGACERLRDDYGDLFQALLPGETVTARNGHREPGITRADWIATLPEPAWPARGAAAGPPAPFGPATGVLRLDHASRQRLPAVLDQFAGFLYGSSLFMEMYLLDRQATKGRCPSMAFVLMEGDDVADGHANGGTVWEWDPNGCRFLPGTCRDPERDVVAGARCWASDLLAVLEVRMPAASMTVGRLSGWNNAPQRLRFDIPNLLHMYCHPLRWPERFLKLYQALARGSEPQVRWGGHEAAPLRKGG